MMDTANFVGRWMLTGSGAFKSEISFVGNKPERNSVANWLNGFDSTLAAEVEPTAGLELEIHPDSVFPGGVFSERATAKLDILWYDAEGVLCSKAEPFDGFLATNKQGVYLRPVEIPDWGFPVKGKYGKVLLRLDDGDTKICDRIAADDDRLIRIINVVTDELYLDRIVLVYQRV